MKIKSPAFTIIELLVVVVIVGILVTVVTISYGGLTKKAYDNNLQSNINKMADAQEIYSAKNLSVAGKAYFYSGTGDGYDADLDFRPSEGTVIDAVVNGDGYCIRSFNPKSSNSSIFNALEKESSEGVCEALGPSGMAIQTSIVWSSDQNFGEGYSFFDVDASSDGSKIALILQKPGDSSTNKSVFISRDSGQTWQEQTNLGKRFFEDISISDDGNKIIAVTWGSYIHYTTDGGSTWSTPSSPIAKYWNNIEVSSSGTIAYVDGGAKYPDTIDYIYKSTNSGASWSVISTLSNGSYVSASDTGARLIAKKDGYIYKSTNYGSSWVQVTAAGNKSWYDLGLSGDGNVIIADEDNGYIYTSVDFGVTWQRRDDAGIKSTQRRLSLSYDGRVMAAHYSSSIPDLYISNNFGESWLIFNKSIFPARISESFISYDGKKILAAGYNNVDYDILGKFYTGILQD